MGRKRTEVVEVINSLPKIKKAVFPQVKGLGTYTINVEAEDADNDTLTYSLETGDLPIDVSINSSSGVITCVLTKDTPEKLSFVLVVNDGHGGVVKKALSMSFFKQPIQPPTNDKQS